MHLAALPKAYTLGQLAYLITGANLGSNGMPPHLLADRVVSKLPPGPAEGCLQKGIKKKTHSREG